MIGQIFNRTFRCHCMAALGLLTLSGCEDVEGGTSGHGALEQEYEAGTDTAISDSEYQGAAVDEAEENEQRRIGCSLMCTELDPCNTQCWHQGSHTTCGGAGFTCGQLPPNVFCERYEDKYISLKDDGGSYPALNDNKVNVDREANYHWRARWKVSCYGDKVAFENDDRYMRARDGWNGWIDTQSFVGSWEKWTPLLQSNGKWAFRSAHGRYLYHVAANYRQRNSINADTTFVVQER